MSVGSQLSARPVSTEDPVLEGLCARHGVEEVNEALVAACRTFTSSQQTDDPPVRLDLLLKATGARREVRSLVGDGRLEVDAGGRFVVVVDDGQHWSRQRFTVAHELAHIILFSEFADDPAALCHLRSPELWPVVERACNAAAAELLMPTDDLAATVARVGLSPSGLSELHARYAVSWSALLVRLSEVLLLPVAVFRWHARHRFEPERWRVHRFYGSAHGVWLPTGMTTRHLSVPIVEQAAAIGVAEADLIIDTPRHSRMWALASSLVDARTVSRQEPLFGHQLPEESSRWPEIAVFLCQESSSNGVPDPQRFAMAGTSEAEGREEAWSDSSNLTLW